MFHKNDLLHKYNEISLLPIYFIWIVTGANILKVIILHRLYFIYYVSVLCYE